MEPADAGEAHVPNARMLLAEVVAIGDELVSGQRLDTNSQWLSQQLGEIGVAVGWHSTVGDDLARNIDVFRTALERADVVITTGGLGPTADDLTREALAAVQQVELLLDPTWLAHIRQMFERRGREMPERNQIQAMFPVGSTPIPNPHGTAPGIDMSYRRASGQPSRVFALPGVPAEMKDMWEGYVRGAIFSMSGAPTRRIMHRTLKCFGLGESEIERRLPDLIQRGREPQVGITASQATITLRITAVGDSEEACQALIQPTEQLIRESLGDLVFGDGEDELQHALIHMLRAAGLRLAVTEIATQGLVSQWLTQVDPLGEFFVGGRLGDAVTFPSSTSQTAADPVAAPPEIAAQLIASAAEVRQAFQADIGLAIGRLSAASDEQATTTPSGPAEIAMGLVDPRGTFHARHPIAGHPEIVVPRAAKQALDLVRRRLLKMARESND